LAKKIGVYDDDRHPAGLDDLRVPLHMAMEGRQ
jgi:hypothetical protein